MSVEANELQKIVQSTAREMIDIRHHLHTIPEEGFSEFKTSGFIKKEVSQLAVENEDPILETAGVFLMNGSEEGPNVTLRSDIDALTIEDGSENPWRSTHPGCNHACGHDGHMAVMLGTMKVLDHLRDRFKGSVRFVFQPAEETEGGGKMMVEAGLLDRSPQPKAVFALHGWPGIPLGTLAAGAGPRMASADLFSLTIRGRGSHGARPHNSVDPILIGAQVVSAFQSIISRNIDPLKSAVLSICQFSGGSTPNVIPNEVFMQGTVRYFDMNLRTFIDARMNSILSHICAMHGAEYTLEYRDGYIPLVNDAAMDALAQETLTSLGLGWELDPEPNMAAEDFAYFLREIPGVMLRLGLGENQPDLHSPHFDFNDDALPHGILALSALTLKVLDALDT